MSYYNYDTISNDKKESLKHFLLDNKIYFEISGGAGLYHFEMLTDPAGADKIYNFLFK